MDKHHQSKSIFKLLSLIVIVLNKISILIIFNNLFILLQNTF